MRSLSASQSASLMKKAKPGLRQRRQGKQSAMKGNKGVVLLSLVQYGSNRKGDDAGWQRGGDWGMQNKITGSAISHSQLCLRVRHSADVAFGRATEVGDTPRGRVEQGTSCSVVLCTICSGKHVGGRQRPIFAEVQQSCVKCKNS